MDILVLNCGSSSVKFAVIDSQTGANRVVGLGERLGQAESRLEWKIDGKKEQKPLGGGDHAVALRAVVDLLRSLGLAAGIRGIGHRVVHGGSRFSASVIVNAAVKDGIKACFKLGPLHNPPNLLGIDLAEELFPGLPNVAVFDTSFHATMPEKAYLYAVPWELYQEQGVRRYGFHGTSHRFVAGKALEALGLVGKPSGIVTAHLGNGCSAAAVKDGTSVDTTMGLTPLEGLVMGTRSGDVDPALHGFLQDNLGWDAKKTIDVLNKKSGLLGLSGVSNDMRSVVEAHRGGNRRATTALEVFTYRLAKAIAGLVAGLDRFDAVVFTGGIGENNPEPIRAWTCKHLQALGVELDPARNANHGAGCKGVISPEGRRPAVVVVPTNEELVIAQDTAALVGKC